jgi:hypothetical protein
MREVIAKLNSGEKVTVTSDELNFKDVLEEGFNESKEIIIFTYNIDNDMKKKLEDLTEETIVHLVVNNTSFNNLAQLSSLHPENFNCKLNIYLCVLNHAKLILTDKYFYFGSANFSGFSKYNFEIGTITNTTPELVAQVKKQLRNLSRVSAMIGYPDLLIQDKLEQNYDVYYSVHSNPSKLEEIIDSELYHDANERATKINNLIKEIMDHIDVIKDDEFEDFLESIKEVLEVEEYYPETWGFEEKVESGRILKYINKIRTQTDYIQNKINNLEQLCQDVVEDSSEIYLEDISDPIKDIIEILEVKKNSLTTIEKSLGEILNYLDIPSIESRREKLRREYEADGVISESIPIIYLPDEKIIANIDFKKVNPYLSNEDVKKRLDEQFKYLEKLKTDR